MALIAPGVCRFTINGSFTGGNQIDNVFDYFIDTTGTIDSRAEAIYNMAGILINQWTADILPEMMNAYSADSVSWVDLDEENGTVGSRSSSGSIAWPDPGGRAGSVMSSQVAQLATKRIPGQRGRRNGRTFFGPPSEADTAGNFISGTRINAWNSALADFLGNTNQESPLGDTWTSEMCVVHTTTKDPEVDLAYVGRSRVLSIQMNALLATQRRRIRD